MFMAGEISTVSSSTKATIRSIRGAVTIFDSVFLIYQTFVRKLCKERGDKIHLPVNDYQIFNTLTLPNSVQSSAAVNNTFLSHPYQHIRKSFGFVTFAREPWKQTMCALKLHESLR